MKRKLFTFAILVSLLVSQISIGTIQNSSANTVKKEYIIITEDTNGHDVATKTLSSDEAEQIKQQDGVVVVEEDGEVRGSWKKNNVFDKEPQEKQVNETEVSSNDWNMQIINADTDNVLSEAAAASGSAVKVAVIDSGINYDENINVVERKNFIEEDTGNEDVSYLYEDISGHGTSIAGIIGSGENDDNDIIGINPNVEIYSAKVLDKNLDAPVSRVIEAIYWAIDQDVNIISISFGVTKEYDSLKTAIQDAYDAGILMIAAAGNDGEVEYPAAYNEVMAVGSVDSEGNASDFSPESKKIEIVAPGENIESSAAFGGEMTGSGTSMSVPHVVGAASVLWQKDSSCSADFVRNLIDYSANLYGESTSYGNGLVDLDYALEIYDEFKSLYVDDDLESAISEAEDAGLIENNSSDINSGNVDGNWNGESHISLGNLGYNTHGDDWSTARYLAFMHGCTYPDSSIVGINQFHGHLWDGSKDSNYITCYMYLTKIAKKLSAGSKITSGTISQDSCNMSDNDYSDMDGVIRYSSSSSKVGDETWKTIFSEASTEDVTVSNKAENRAAFIYGVALHAATDAIAHNTWRYDETDDGRAYYKITHSTDKDKDDTVDADDKDFISARYKCAKHVAKRVAYRCNNSAAGTLYDFVIPKSYYDEDGLAAAGSQDFLFGNFRYYAQESNSSIYSSYKSYFRYGDLYYQCENNDWTFQYTYNGITHTAQ